MEKEKLIRIKEFLSSDLDESEFFEVSKKDSISLDEYRQKMIDLDRKFQKMARFEVESIKRKCGWVDAIWFESLQDKKTGEFFLPTLHVFSKDGKDISSFEEIDGSFDFSAKFPKLFLINPNIRRNIERRKNIQKCQSELKEIDLIGKEVYEGKLYDRKSVSDNFKAVYRPDSGLYLFNSNSDNITAYLKENRKNYDKPLAKDKDKDKLLRKILIKND